jgi:hypothetical protein
VSVLAGQALAFVEPLVRALLEIPEYEVFREAIEDRENLRWLIDRLEELEASPLDPGEGAPPRAPQP